MLCFVCNAIQTTNHMDPHIKRYDFNVSNAKKFNIGQIPVTTTYAWRIVILEDNGEEWDNGSIKC